MIFLKLLNIINFLATFFKVASIFNKVRKIAKLPFSTLASGKVKVGLFTILLVYLVAIHLGLWYAYQKYKGCIISSGKATERYKYITAELNACLELNKEKDKTIKELQRKYDIRIDNINKQLKDLKKQKDKELELCYSYIDELIGKDNDKSKKEKENRQKSESKDKVLDRLNSLF